MSKQDDRPVVYIDHKDFMAGAKLGLAYYVGDDTDEEDDSNTDVSESEGLPQGEIEEDDGSGQEQDLDADRDTCLHNSSKGNR